MQTLNYFATLVLLIIASLSLVFNTFVTMDWHEIPIIWYNRIWLIPLFVCFLGMLIIAQPILQKIYGPSPEGPYSRTSFFFQES